MHGTVIKNFIHAHPFHCTKIYVLFSGMYRLSLVDMSGVTVLFGVTGPTNIQMTRRISKLYLHSQYNAANYVRIQLDQNATPF
jgi:hypothetical protein